VKDLSLQGISQYAFVAVNGGIEQFRRKDSVITVSGAKRRIRLAACCVGAHCSLYFPLVSVVFFFLKNLDYFVAYMKP
jgi:hypothetical protein